MSAAASGAGTFVAPSFVIAIDGPSGTGKSTVARRVAAALQAGYLDTGAMYRLVTLAVLDAGIAPDDADAVAALVPTVTLDPPTDPGRQQHRLADRVVTEEIRGAAVTRAVTPVSANPVVRAALGARQRELARSGRMVVEGRDIGTVIVPDAELKVYLTADADERARRRYHQDAARSPRPAADETVAPAGDLAAVALDLARRDVADSSREHAPLQAADDAVIIDSSQMVLAETVATVLRLAAERGIA